jgi:hypothetical protein
MSSQLQVSGEAKIRDIQGPVVANSGVITALDGAASQYVRGDGTLADFPTSTGGGSSVSYYLNSSVSQGTIGGVAYRQLGKTPIAGAGTDIAISANGYVASYITDANDPALLEVPAGNFNCEFYFSVNNNTGNPFTYAEVYKYDGTTFTLLGTSVGVPEYITEGTVINPYYFAVPVSSSVLSITDRIAIRIYVNVDGRTVTLHTENNHLCQVVTTFSKGLTSLNNLTRQVQFLATGTSGTDFNIVSSVATHTFNIPDASPTARGLITTSTQNIAGSKTFNDAIGANYGIALYNGAIPPITSIYYAALSGNSTGLSITYRTGGGTNYTNNLNFPANNNSYAFPATGGTLALTTDISYPVTSVFGRTGAVVAASGDYTTTQVTEGTNLYFTDARARAALSAGTGISYNNTTGVITSTITQYTDALARAALSFTAGSGAYNSTTGVITIPTDNNQIANGAGYITSSALSGYLPLTGGTLTGGLNGTTATFSGLGTFNQITMTGATAGRLFYAQTGGVFSQSGNLVWNNSTEMLGVGTPNPSAVITAFSTNAATQFKAAGTAPAITFSNTLTSASLACVFGLATANNHFITGTAAGDMAIANQSTSAGAIVFGTGTFEKMRMSSSGSFGIGTSSPVALLDVNGNGKFTSSSFPLDIYGTTNNYGLRINNVQAATLFLYSSNANAASRNWGLFTNSEVYGDFDIRQSNAINGDLTNGANSTSRLYIKNDGNVGIGTSSPSSILDIQQSSTTNVAISFMNTYGATSSTAQTVDIVSKLVGSGLTGQIGSMIRTGKEGDYSSGGARDAYMSFSTAENDNLNERMRITSGGDVLVGTTAIPNGTSVYGTAIGLASFGRAIIFQGVSTTISATMQAYFNPNGQVGSITTNGSATFFNVTSDYRLKQDLKDYNGLELVSAIKTYDYEWKSDKSRMYGVIAHELKEILPYAVTGEKDDKEMQSVDYSKIVPILVKAIQEQQTQIEELKAIINK